VRRAKVFVDLANKSCAVSTNDTHLGTWAPGITRRTVEDTIADAGWMFAPGSEWTLTVDGGVRDVVQSPVGVDDTFLDDIGCAIPCQSTGPADDELGALLLAWRDSVECCPIPDLVNDETAMAAISRGRAA